MTRWAITVFAVAGAFLVCGLLGAGASTLLGRWELPGAGFLAALGVVSVAYLAAPTRKVAFSTLCFAVGVLLAWRLVGTASYPESYGESAYRRTLLPFAATCVGGLLGLIAVMARGQWNRGRGA